MSTNAHIWASRGISEEGFAQCDAAMPLMLEAIVRAGGPALAKSVLEEAVFQLVDLPHRTEEFQAHWKWRAQMTDLLETSPQPWDASDKVAMLYDLAGELIAVFGEGRKDLHDLNNRNRAAVCVNALMGIDNPRLFVRIALEVADGRTSPLVLDAVRKNLEVFSVHGEDSGGIVRSNPEAGPKSFGAMPLDAALRMARDYQEAGGEKIAVVFLPTGEVVERIDEKEGCP